VVFFTEHLANASVPGLISRHSQQYFGAFLKNYLSDTATSHTLEKALGVGFYTYGRNSDRMFTRVMLVIASQYGQQSDITWAGKYPPRFRSESWRMWSWSNTHCIVIFNAL